METVIIFSFCLIGSAVGILALDWWNMREIRKIKGKSPMSLIGIIGYGLLEE